MRDVTGDAPFLSDFVMLVHGRFVSVASCALAVRCVAGVFGGSTNSSHLRAKVEEGGERRFVAMGPVDLIGWLDLAELAASGILV